MGSAIFVSANESLQLTMSATTIDVACPLGRFASGRLPFSGAHGRLDTGSADVKGRPEHTAPSD